VRASAIVRDSAIVRASARAHEQRESQRVSVC